MSDLTLFHQNYRDRSGAEKHFHVIHSYPWESDLILSYDGVSGAVKCWPGSAYGDRGKVIVGGLTPALKTKLEDSDGYEPDTS